jgi:hypothetical protein
MSSKILLIVVAQPDGRARHDLALRRLGHRHRRRHRPCCLPRRAVEFRKFLARIEQAVPADRLLKDPLLG